MKDIEPRQNKINQSAFKYFFPLINTVFSPGKCMDKIEAMENEFQKKIAFAEYYYFSGKPEKAVQEVRDYLYHPDISLKLSAKLIFIYASLSLGEIRDSRYELEEIRKLFVHKENDSEEIKAMKVFVATGISVLLHLPQPEYLPSLAEVCCCLPLGLRAFSLYIYCHYLYLKKDYQKSAGMAEAALMMGGEKYPIPSIYLHLSAVMNYMNLKETEKARRHFAESWKLAHPDDLVEGFGEHHGLLGGMLESAMKREWPEDFKRVISITYRFAAGWRSIHNPETGENVAGVLTTTEFAIAMLAAHGWTNPEIAAHMNISPNTVKCHLSRAMEKVNVSHRQELKEYLLQ